MGLNDRELLRELESDYRIDEVWQEPDGCFEDDTGSVMSWWASLAPGYRWDDCITLHEGTLEEMVNRLEDVYHEADCD